MKSRLIYLLIILIILIIIAYSLGTYCVIPARSQTVTNMCIIVREIKTYHRKYNQLPLSLNDIALENCCRKDYYGKNIIYKIHDNRIYLISYGKDGKKGGSNDCKDIVCYWYPMLEEKLSPYFLNEIELKKLGDY